MVLWDGGGGGGGVMPIASWSGGYSDFIVSRRRGSMNIVRTIYPASSVFIEVIEEKQ